MAIKVIFPILLVPVLMISGIVLGIGSGEDVAVAGDVRQFYYYALWGYCL
ncbi:hypothetical protein [Syntrophomonas wolfei]|nr:hypothetical protein [Syntrophomonas wolfei]